LLGGLGLGTLEQFASGYLSSLFAVTFALAFLLAVLVWRPNGLFASARRREDVRDIATQPVAPLVRLSKRTITAAGTLAIVLIAVLPFVLQASGAISGIVITGLLFIALLGLDVLLGYAGQVSLGHTAFLAIGAYSAAICTTRYHWEPIAGIAVGLIVSLMCATILSLVTVRLRGHYMALATLSFGLLADSIAVGATGLTGGPSGITGVPHFAVGRFSFDSQLQNYYLVWIIAIVATVGLANLMRSGFGRALRAIRTDQTAARALGINVPRYKLMAFLISAAFVSIAGSLYAYYFQYISPEMVGTNRIFDLLGSLVVGGEGTLVGPVIGAAILTLLPSIFQPFAIYKTLAVGVLLILALLYFPSGIYGGIIQMAQRRGRL
jgi:branched-chain amino acid transport system permease protein